MMAWDDVLKGMTSLGRLAERGASRDRVRGPERARPAVFCRGRHERASRGGTAASRVPDVAFRPVLVVVVVVECASCDEEVHNGTGVEMSIQRELSFRHLNRELTKDYQENEYILNQTIMMSRSRVLS